MGSLLSSVWGGGCVCEGSAGGGWEGWSALSVGWGFCFPVWLFVCCVCVLFGGWLVGFLWLLVRRGGGVLF